MKKVLLRTILVLSILCIGKAHAGWLWPDHYYLISSTSGDEYTSKGEPWEKGDFTVFTQWPEKKEFRIKTALVDSIKDTGSLSPEELEAKAEKELAAEESKEAKKWTELKKRVEDLFPMSEKTHYPHLVPATLEQARSMGASDQQIWEVLEETPKGADFKEMHSKHFSLDEIADSLKRLEDSKKEVDADAMEHFRGKRDIFDEIWDKQNNKQKVSD